MATPTINQGGSTPTSVLGLQPYPLTDTRFLNNISAKGDDGGSAADNDLHENLPPPATAVDALQQWNTPRINMWRVFATFFTFAMMGMNDAAYGALIPYLETYYKLTYTVVSLIFLSPFVGFTLASLCNDLIHMKFGQRGISILGPSCHVIVYVVLAVHPPYPVLVVVFVAAGFGNGLMDAAWCAWIGNMASANRVSGFLQACYSLGATLSPLIATAMVTKAQLPWYYFYYLMTGGAVIELSTCTWAFWHKTGAEYRLENPRESGSKGGRTREALGNKITWLCAIFLLGYVGAEVALGGWIVTFMLRIRSATPFSSGISVVGFWAGMTVGRVLLGFVTERFGERFSVAIYLLISMCLELIFWLVPQFVVSAIAVALLGFFLGPLFPAAIVVSTKLLPKHLHVSAIGFAAAFGGGGGAIAPFGVGAIAQAKGVQVLQPIILALLVVISGLWFTFPRIRKQDRRVEGEERFFTSVLRRFKNMI